MRPVAHDADRSHIGQRREVLAHAAFQIGLGDLLTKNEVRLPQHVQLHFSDLTDHTVARPAPGEGLALDQILGKAQLSAQLADLVFEEQSQRFNDLPEIIEIRKAAYVVMALGW